MIAKTYLAETFRRLAPVSDSAIAALSAVTIHRSFEASSWLLEAGEQATWCFLLTQGLVRELYIGEDGAEHTRSFIPEGHMTGSLLDLLTGEPSITWIQALEPTVTLAWRYADFDALCARFPELHLVARRSAEALYVKKTRREHDMLALSASQRYRRFCDEHPHIDARISRRHLASYLGMTPEHLSRLGHAESRRSRLPKRER